MRSATGGGARRQREFPRLAPAGESGPAPPRPGLRRCCRGGSLGGAAGRAGPVRGGGCLAGVPGAVRAAGAGAEGGGPPRGGRRSGGIRGSGRERCAAAVEREALAVLGSCLVLFSAPRRCVQIEKKKSIIKKKGCRNRYPTLRSPRAAEREAGI